MSWKRANVKKRMSVFLSNLPSFETGSYMLDIGTGSGVFASLLEDQYPQANIIQSDIRRLTKLHHFIQSAVQSHPSRYGSYSLIVCAQVLHYIPTDQLEQTVHQLLMLLKQNGLLVIIEYQTNRSYSWLPYPIPRTWWDAFIQNNVHITVISDIRDTDRIRPKYAIYLQ